MARAARCESIDPSEIQTFHVYNRCVRRTFLCGYDQLSDRDFSHRKVWLKERMRFLTSIFAFDVGTFAILSNHFHMLVRSRPDVVAAWSDEEVIERNLRLAGRQWFGSDGSPRKSTQAKIQRLLRDPAEIAKMRSKLSDLSSLMWYFDLHIAVKSNREDQVKGVFWEGRFGHTVLTNEAAILACMVYIDLNMIHGQLAATPEESEYTGAYERICDLATYLAIHQTPQLDIHFWEREGDHPSGWLAPIEIDQSGDPAGPDIDPSGCRPSRKGFLSCSLAKYLEILDWGGRRIRSDKSGSISDSCLLIFQRLGFSSAGFQTAMMSFHLRLEPFFQATERQGQPESTIFETVGIL